MRGAWSLPVRMSVFLGSWCRSWNVTAGHREESEVPSPRGKRSHPSSQADVEIAEFIPSLRGTTLAMTGTAVCGSR